MTIRLVLPLALAALTIVSCECDDPAGADGGPGADDDGGPVFVDDGGFARFDGGPLPGDDGGFAACIQGLDALTLDPASQSVALDGSAAADITFTVTGQFGGSSTAIDAAQLVWSATRADDTPPGDVAAGVFSPNPSAGGTVTITATDGCVSGTATVTFTLDATVGTPTDAAAWGGAPTTDGDVPAPIYPSDETRLPRNIFRTLFQWDNAGYTEFRLTFTGPAGSVTVYTDGVHADCADANSAGCWEVDETTWEFIAGSNAGEEVVWTVDGLDTSTDPATVRRSVDSTLGISLRDVRGAIFYWSTTSKGIRRGNIRDAEPDDYMTGDPGTAYPPDDVVKCVACHTVSRDGRYIAAPTDAESGKSLWIMGVTANVPPDPLVTFIDKTEGHMFATFSPDNEHVVAATKKDGIFMVNRDDGSFIEDLPVDPYAATHPDWSPDGTQLVFATGEGDAPGGASLAILPRANDQWGTPEVILDPVDDRTLVYPMFSPEGDWIAYSEGKGGHGDEEMLLFIVGPDGSDNIELTAANRVVNNAETDGLHQNAGPTWAPPGDLHWVAFNSKREYGVVLGAGTQQIWVAAVDVTKIPMAVDPSYPAFRVPFQGLEENNHRAFWALDVREEPGFDAGPADAGYDAGYDAGWPPPPDAGGYDAGYDAGPCPNTGELCDPVGNACCSPFDLCDTFDDGDTYTCVNVVGG
jgi:Tol biopolymer transport system component